MQTNPTIKLRAMEPNDIDAIYRWENDPTLWQYSAAHQPFARSVLQQFIEQQADADIYTTRQLRLMADTDGDRAVGCVDLFDFDPYHRRAAIGLIVDSHYRHSGYGAAIVRQLEAFAVQHLLLHQLHCTIAADNQHCINLFTHSGYTPAGTLRQWVWNGQQWGDAVILQKVLDNTL